MDDGYYVFDPYGQFVIWTNTLEGVSDINPDDIIVEGSMMTSEQHGQDVFYDLKEKKIVFQDYPEGSNNPEGD